MVAFVLALALLAGEAPLSLAERVEGARAVERARYRFVIGVTQPFDAVYPRSVFEARAKREIAAEGVLERLFGLRVTREDLEAELDRIERETRAPEQWEAVKHALGDSRRRIEEVVCRPLLVDRLLRARFAFNPTLHAKEHREARRARETFLAGGTPGEAILLRLSREAEACAAAPEGPAQGQAAAAGGGSTASSGATSEHDRPVTVHPEMARTLERELKTKGDVTTILEEKGRFSVFRLVEAEATGWRVEAVRVPKRDFRSWLEDAIGDSATSSRGASGR